MVAERIPAGFPVERHGDLTRKAETDARIIWFSTARHLTLPCVSLAVVTTGSLGAFHRPGR